MGAIGDGRDSRGTSEWEWTGVAWSQLRRQSLPPAKVELYADRCGLRLLASWAPGTAKPLGVTPEQVRHGRRNYSGGPRGPRRSRTRWWSSRGPEAATALRRRA